MSRTPSAATRPRAAAADTARGFVPVICARVTAGIATWRETGEIPEMPGRPEARAAAAAATTTTATTAAPAAVARTGRSLEPAVQSRMGAAFGADFSDVRVHTGMATAGARALTVGRDIAFAPGQFEPGTPVGDALIAHELAHVLQQDPLAAGGGASGAYERDADRAAVGVLARLAGLDGPAVRPQLRRGVALQRCGDTATTVAPPVRRPYKEIVAELRGLRARKEAILAGTEPVTAQAEIDARVAELAAELRDHGIMLDPNEILDRIAADPNVDLKQVRGRLVFGPAESFWGARMRFHALVEYIPPRTQDRARLALRPGDGHEREFPLWKTLNRVPDTMLELDEEFWLAVQGWKLDQTRQMDVKVRIYLGDEDAEQTTLSSGVLKLPDKDLPPKLSLTADPAVVIAGGDTVVQIPEVIPAFQRYSVDWEIDGKPKQKDVPALGIVLSDPGGKKVVAKVYKVKRAGTLMGPGVAIQAARDIESKELVRTADTAVTVQSPKEAADVVMGQMGSDSLPHLSTLEDSIKTSIEELERKVSEGGEQAEYWEERLDAQRKRLRKLRENEPDLEIHHPLPQDPLSSEDPIPYSGPIKAVLVVPGRGVQPLNIYVSGRKQASGWKVRLLDMTSSDVYSRDGEGATQLEAYEMAFRAWIDDHPYPHGGTVTYQFPGTGLRVPTSFKTKDTAWDTVKRWVDGVLLIAGVLLAVPEPSMLTKVIAGIIVTAGVARSAVAIYENLQVGIDPLDKRNVLEGISIVTSTLGLSGTLLRSAGITTMSPMVYRAGNWMVMGSLAGDAGTLAFMAYDAYASLQAIRANPTLDEGQKSMETMRVIAQLMASGTLFFVSNRDLFKQGIRPSEFIKPKSPDVRLGEALPPATKLDFGVELRKAGDIHTAERIRTGKVSDQEILDRNAVLPWLKTMPPADVSDLTKRATLDTLVAAQDLNAADFKRAFDQIGDDKLANALAPKIKGQGLVGYGRLKQADPKLKIEPLPDGQLRLDDQITVGPARLADLGDAELQKLTKAVAALKHDPEVRKAVVDAKQPGIPGGEAAVRKRLNPVQQEQFDTINELGSRERLRFDYQTKQADDFLREMDLTDDPMFGNLTQADRIRLFDMRTQTVPGGGGVQDQILVKRRFAEYAMARAKTPLEFVEHFSFAAGEYKARLEGLEKAYKADAAALKAAGENEARAQRKAGERLGFGGRNPDGSAQPSTALALVREEIDKPGWLIKVQVTEQMRLAEIKPFMAPGPKLPTEPDAAIAQLKTAANIPFDREIAAAYHVHKHHSEMPEGQQYTPGGKYKDEAEAYLGTAHDVIRDSDSTFTHTATQDGKGRSYAFTRTVKGRVPGTANEKNYKQMVVVEVGADGKAVMTTFMPDRGVR